MNTVIYFDQNALSDLRERKRKNRQEFRKIYDLLLNGNVFTFYSYTHLDEIRNIPRQDYQDEHIDTLCDIRAIYIKPMDRGTDSRSPRIIWNEYLDNNIENDIDGGTDIELAFENLGKKISGLPIKDSVTQMHDNIQNQALSLIMQAENGLLEMTHEELAFEGTSAKEIKTYISKLKQQALDIRANLF